ncbi:zinc/cadmium/mercury/lead-transporting ATPase [Morganella morganii]|uniref:zinc/cadmium/mercury/lead-transporting ATPase n=1 Tax=Morganella morganii TaxID=582 RepID=UPI000787A526|nr:zinc/cadmium/mercury/lead-transporting ATPase [Morganella morganii]EKV4234779.1 zinc/cadmium/mercury/lead-transporting ATPase [Morganella morganii]ELL8927902.1 zinc/cadmium/mercury/lead-transporting ATPase [Morganella morganii]ELY4880488.1 zinc/cadmium/mercury/lead-transporting ATPase [Morganella morganii]MBS9570694.1 zinc/cadmium/mercury/lead-transporting ATPase [Morganella morganii subsp. morganii]MBT0391053.1 zinc/cadmium/mercury/lead-transporting ATPase [Morganella morganii subsp. morga
MHPNKEHHEHTHTSNCCGSKSACTTGGKSESQAHQSHDHTAHDHSEHEHPEHDDDESRAHGHAPHDHAHSEHDHDHAGHEHAHGSCCSHDHAAPDDTALPELSGSQRYNWQVEGMDCPSCARKIETAVLKIAAVTQAKVMFATEKLVVDAAGDVRADVTSAVQQAGFVLWDLNGSSAAPKKKEEQSLLKQATPMLILAVLIALSYALEFVNPEFGKYAFIASTLIGLFPIAKSSLRLIRSGTPFAIETLMTVAAVGAIIIGATEEAAMVILLFLLGEMLESYAAGRARRGVSALMALVPEDAVVIKDGQKVSVPVAQLRPGDIIEIAPGGRLPTDAELLSEFASFDESALTGESVPVERAQGEKVAAGSLSVDRAVQMKVVSEQGQNAIDRILTLIEEAEERRAPIERFIDRFSRYYTPMIMLFSALVIVIPPLFMGQEWYPWIYRGLTLLLIGCPCALVISTPAAITSALAAATRRGALIKGGAALEQLGTVTTVALDKTGTLTEGKPQVTDIVALNSHSDADVLTFASAVESGSHHPLAKAILERTEALGLTITEAENRKAHAGKGVEGELSGVTILVSAPGKLADGLLTDAAAAEVTRLENEGKTVVAVVAGNRLTGLIAMQDTLRSDAIEAISQLKAMGVSAVMLTGDNPRAAAAIAGTIGMDFRAGLMPEDKVKAVMALNNEHHTMMVGDGINDAPAMKAASIGVAMGSGTDVALETADAALTHNRLTGIAEVITLSRATRKIIRENITIALGLKAVFLVTTLMGLTGLWVAVLADSGATALVTANAVRLLRVMKK